MSAYPSTGPCPHCGASIRSARGVHALACARKSEQEREYYLRHRSWPEKPRSGKGYVKGAYQRRKPSASGLNAWWEVLVSGTRKGTRMPSRSFWVLELIERATGRVRCTSPGLSRKELRDAFSKVLFDAAVTPSYAWQLEIRARWSGKTCPAGHPVDEHSYGKTSQDVERDWAEFMADMFRKQREPENSGGQVSNVRKHLDYGEGRH
jgi:hypothetical protein